MGTIVKKLADMRCELLASEINKSGKNSFVGFDYLELSDFMPQVIKLEQKYGVTSIITFSKELCILTITDGEDELEFTCPFVMPEVKGATTTQNLGAAITYIKRYLYVNAYCILGDKDVLDANMNPKKDEDTVTITKPMTEAQRDIIFKLGCNIDNVCKFYGVDSIDELTCQQASEVIKKKKNQ